MIPIKNKDGVAGMREACRVAAAVLAKMRALAAAGITTYDLDQEAKKIIEGYGARSACFNYRTARGQRAYPAYTCISVNEEVVHGIGSIKRILRPGDIVSLDVVVEYGGWIGDNATTVRIAPIAPEVERLLQVTESALGHGIAAAKVGNRIGDVSNAIQTFVESHGFSVVRDMVGHGVGRSMHEEPQIPNFGRKGTGEKIRPGMTLAIEPMVNTGTHRIETLGDSWTIVTADGKPSAHFEHTVLTTESGPEILTIPPA
ncbi:MAG TPA: type I methionyl aminopeptidase [Opitutaceae bacterium]|nr:type I methionyl aminopeptidase [Opitutaceae bacterium]